MDNQYVHSSTFRNIYADLMKFGKEISPRGTKCIEIENYEYFLPPYVRFASFDIRKLSISYIKKEFKWYLRGDKYDTSIGQSASLWNTLINRDGSINSNYGQYIFGIMNQFDNVVKILAGDKDSRRASIMILKAEHLLSDSKDFPCTYSMNFRIRDNKLNMSVRMRSQDSVYGMGNDAPAFSFIHEMVFVCLKEVYPELELGEYCHSSDSFHVYEKHYEMVKKIVDLDNYTLVECPRISSKKEVDFLRAGKFEEIPAEFEFAKWLNN
jgi:thymidylate synthase